MIFVLIIINIGSFIIILFIHIPTHPREVWNIIKGYPSYLSYQGCYTHTMLIYSFCNVDDVSWGTKGAGDTGGKKY
jgi:chitin synthase